MTTPAGAEPSELPPYLPVEPFTDRVGTRMGGCRVDTLLPEAPGKKNADYYFKTEHTVVELKQLSKDHFGPEDYARVTAAFMWAVKKGLVSRRECREWVRNPTPWPPPRVRHRMVSLFRRTLQGAIHTADKQIKMTLEDLEPEGSGHGLLLLVNDNNFFLTLMGQVGVVANILLDPRYAASPIEGFVYTSVNIGVDLAGSDRDHSAWVPLYRDAPPDENFVTFVNRFGKEFQQLLYEDLPKSAPPFQTDDASYLAGSHYIYRSPSHSTRTNKPM